MHEVLVTSDQHLGYDNSNIIDFSRFLDYIYSRKDGIESFVILGDFVDMWRRDVSGLFLEHFNIINKLLTLRSIGITIYFITGDHDYHLLKLKDHSYPFEFLAYLNLPSASSSNLKYNFKHGWEFDLEQNPLVMEALCHNMSDTAGHARSSTAANNILQITKDYFNKDIKEVINFHGGINGYLEHLETSPELRLKQFLSDVERRAYSAVNDGEILIFGHTHRPFVSIDHKLVNTGSWVSDAPINNTFVSLEGKEIKLFQFRDHTITDITNIVTGTLEQTLTSLTNNLNMFDNISDQFRSLTGKTDSQPVQSRCKHCVKGTKLASVSRRICSHNNDTNHQRK